MSAATLQAIEDAVIAHHRDTLNDDDSPERKSAIITAWVVGYEVSNIVDLGPDDGGSVLGFANSYAASDASPNLVAHLAAWVATEIDSSINGADYDEDDEDA